MYELLIDHLRIYFTIVYCTLKGGTSIIYNLQKYKVAFISQLKKLSTIRNSNLPNNICSLKKDNINCVLIFEIESA